MVKIRKMAILPPYQYCDVLSVDVSTIGYEHREIVCSEMVATGAATRRITQYCSSLSEDKEASAPNFEGNECMVSKHRQWI